MEQPKFVAKHQEQIKKELASFLVSEPDIHLISGDEHGPGRVLLSALPGGGLSANTFFWVKATLNKPLVSHLFIGMPLIVTKGPFGPPDGTPLRVLVGTHADLTLPYSIAVQNAGFLEERSFIPILTDDVIDPKGAGKLLKARENWSELLDRLNANKDLKKAIERYLRDKESVHKWTVKIDHSKDVWGQMVTIDGRTYFALQSAPRYYEKLFGGGYFEFELSGKLEILERLIREAQTVPFKQNAGNSRICGSGFTSVLIRLMKQESDKNK